MTYNKLPALASTQCTVCGDNLSLPSRDPKEGKLGEKWIRIKDIWNEKNILSKCMSEMISEKLFVSVPYILAKVRCQLPVFWCNTRHPKFCMKCNWWSCFIKHTPEVFFPVGLSVLKELLIWTDSMFFETMPEIKNKKNMFDCLTSKSLLLVWRHSTLKLSESQKTKV